MSRLYLTVPERMAARSGAYNARMDTIYCNHPPFNDRDGHPIHHTGTRIEELPAECLWWQMQQEEWFRKQWWEQQIQNEARGGVAEQEYHSQAFLDKLHEEWDGRDICSRCFKEITQG